MSTEKFSLTSDLPALIKSLAAIEGSGRGLAGNSSSQFDQFLRPGYGASAMHEGGPVAQPKKKKATAKVPPIAMSATAPVPLKVNNVEDIVSSTKFVPRKDTELWPDAVLEYKETWEALQRDRVKLPVLRQMSPRTRKKMELMPAPSAVDLTRAAKYDRLANTAVPAAFYKKAEAKAKRYSSSASQKLEKRLFR